MKKCGMKGDFGRMDMVIKFDYNNHLITAF